MSKPATTKRLSATYRLFREAILAEKQVTCIYGGHYRELCPHIIGHTDGAERVFAFQFRGETSTTLPPGGEWRCLHLSDVSKAEMRDGPWYSGSRHQRGQTYVVDIDLDI